MVETTVVVSFVVDSGVVETTVVISLVVDGRTVVDGCSVVVEGASVVDTRVVVFSVVLGGAIGQIKDLLMNNLRSKLGWLYSYIT